MVTARQIDWFEFLRDKAWKDFALLVAGEGVAQDAILEGLALKLEGIEDAAFDSFYREMKAAISGDLSPVAYNEALTMARTGAKDRAKTLTSGMIETELNKIGEVIAEGMDEGLHPYAVARRLEMVKGLDSNRVAQYRKYEKYIDTLGLSEEEADRQLKRKFDKLLNDRKRSIAHTEAAYASETARLSEALAAGAKWKMWITAADERVSDICRNNQSAGPVAAKDQFPSGHDRPPGHPNCRCTLGWAISNAMKEEMERESRELVNQTELAMEGEKG